MSDGDRWSDRSDRFRAAIAGIDRANADDPETIVVDGRAVPKELTHARMMCEWVLRLDEDATEAQILAARAHHLRRWDLPRTEYPKGRSGYLRWRAEQKRRHAAAVGEIMAVAGYDDDDIAHVQAIVRKQGLATDPAVQTHEDALCLVFLETQFDELASTVGDDHIVDILAKTLPKMSPAGLAAATELPLTDAQATLVDRARRKLVETTPEG